jgi:hypothetical protein
MSDPRFTDPRLSQPMTDDDARRNQRLGELEASNAMWGWIAGGVVLALLLLFIFGRAPDSTTSTAKVDNGIPPASTTTAPPRNPAPPATNAQAPRPQPSTTGQGATPQ